MPYKQRRKSELFRMLFSRRAAFVVVARLRRATTVIASVTPIRDADHGRRARPAGQ
jgi:hypothetical protein